MKQIVLQTLLMIQMMYVFYPDFKEDGEFNVKYTIEDLHATLERELGYFACSRYDDVIIENLYVSMCILVNTEKYIKQK